MSPLLLYDKLYVGHICFCNVYKCLSKSLKLGLPDGCLLITACTSFTFTTEDNRFVAVNGVSLEGPGMLAPAKGIAKVGPDVEAAAFRCWPSTTSDLTSHTISDGSSNELPLASGKYALLPVSAHSHTVEGSSYKCMCDRGREIK